MPPFNGDKCLAEEPKPSGESDYLLPKTIDDLVLQLAGESAQPPLLAYPKSKDSKTVDYEKFNGKDLCRFANRASEYLLDSGLPPLVSPLIDY